MEEIIPIEEEHVNAEVHLMVKTLERNLNKMPTWPSECHIYRVPAALYQEKPQAYIPHIVSIGPFHHDQKHLQRMESRKMQYFKNFLHRSSPGKLKDYIKAVIDTVEMASQCYSEVEINRESFVMMMVVDGCFILELLLGTHDTDSEEKWIFMVLFDLILLENQLPFFVLEALYRVFIEDSGHEEADTCTLNGLICKKFVPQIVGLLVGENTINYSSRDIEQMEPKHLLDFVRQFLIPPKQTVIDGQKNQPKSVGRATKCLHFAPVCIRRLCLGDPLEKYNLVFRIRCATELEKGGVKFEKNEKPTSLLDIEFDNVKGVLRVPSIEIDHGTESILRNLVTYEQFTNDYSYITEYASFLDGLIDSRSVVELLQKTGIIQTILGDPNETARLFNNLLKDVSVAIYYTLAVRHELEQHYNIPWHKWRASLMLNYFNTPWSLISVVAAIILLILTVTQTMYAALSYH